MSLVNRPVSRSRWTRIAVLLFLTFLFAFIDRSNISVAAIPMTKDLGLTKLQMGALLSSFFWGYVITNIPGGYIASLFRAKWVIVISILAWAVLSGLTGEMKTLTSLTVVRFLMGIAEGVLFPAILVIINQWFPGPERARAVNLIESGAPLSSIIMAPLAGWMIAEWNWHTMFIFQAVPPIILAILVMIFVEDSPVRDRFVSAEEKEYILELKKQDELKRQEEAQGKSGSVAGSSIFSIFASPKIWLLAVIYLMLLSGMYSFGLWIPTVLNGMTNVGITAIGFITTIPFIVAMIAMHFLSSASDRTGNRARFIIWPLIIGGAAFVIGRFTTNIYLDFALLCIGCAGCYGPLGSWWSWTMEQVSDKQVGGTVGFVNFAGNFGGVLGPIAVSIAASKTSLYSGFYILGIAMIVGGILATWVNQRNAKRLTTANVTPHSESI